MSLACCAGLTPTPPHTPTQHWRITTQPHDPLSHPQTKEEAGAPRSGGMEAAGGAMGMDGGFDSMIEQVLPTAAAIPRCTTKLHPYPNTNPNTAFSVLATWR